MWSLRLSSAAQLPGRRLKDVCKQRKPQMLGAVLMLGLPHAVCAATLECPEPANNAVALSPLEEQTGSDTEAAGTMDQLIGSLKAKNPGISYDDLTNAAISVYCPLIANSRLLGPEQKMKRIRALNALLREWLAPFFDRR
jgi:hypothetical protein